MQTAILFFVASSVGISVGWQPMPDGSPRYEYVVQLDRELLATLKREDSIPISSEVPDDIRPIARIRIVVGDENLPRQKLVTQFKPWPEGQSREGLVETQYTVSSGAGNPNLGNILPSNKNQPILPADRSSRQILPPKNHPQTDGDSFGQTLQQSAEQARSASTQNQILPPSKEILPPQNSGRYAELIQNANQKQGQLWRDTGASSQADIRQLFGPTAGENSLGNLQPAKERSIVIGDRYSPMPSGSDPISPDKQAILPPPHVPSNPPVTSTPDAFNAPWPAPKPVEDAPLAQEDPPASQPAGNSQSSEWPKTDTPERTATDSQWPKSPPPEIRREMLSRPANAELRTASGGPASTTRASFPPSSQAPTPLPPQSTVISQPQSAGPAGGSVFPLLLAWVLLSGSGAGNLYLFWSYLDIRNKYRGQIRTAGHKLDRRSVEEEYNDFDE